MPTADHRHHHHHHHDVNRHDDRIRAFSLATEPPIPAAMFDMFLDLLRSLHGPNLLRLKGIVKLAETPASPWSIHGVQHVFHPPVQLPTLARRRRAHPHRAHHPRHRAGRRRASCSTPSSAPCARPARSRRARRQPAGARSAASIVDGRCTRLRFIAGDRLGTCHVGAVPDAAARRDAANPGDHAGETGPGHGIDRAADGGRGLPQGCAARAQDDDADRQESDPRVSAGHRRARRQVRRRAGAALRPRALQLPRARRALEPLCALGAGARPAQGRHGLPADAEPAGIPGDLARHHAGRRRRGAAQHQPDRHGARPLHQRRRAQAHHRRRRAVRSLATARASHHHQRRQDLAARRRRRQLPAHRPRGRGPSRRRARGRGPPHAHHRGPRALHLHVGHDRPAEGRQHQPLPRDAREPRLRRRDGHARRATACTIACRSITPPAAWSRPARCWSTAARW